MSALQAEGYQAGFQAATRLQDSSSSRETGNARAARKGAPPTWETCRHPRYLFQPTCAFARCRLGLRRLQSGVRLVVEC